MNENNKVDNKSCLFFNSTVAVKQFKLFLPYAMKLKYLMINFTQTN